MNVSIEQILGRALLFCVVLNGTIVSSSSLWAQELSTPATVVIKGGTVSTQIEFRSKGSAVSGLQFDLQFDRRVLYIEAGIGIAAAAVGKTLSTNVLSNGDLRIVITGLNGTVIGEGIIVELKITVGQFAPTGPQPLVIANVAGVTPDDAEVEVKAHDGRIIAIPSGQPN